MLVQASLPPGWTREEAIRIRLQESARRMLLHRTPRTGEELYRYFGHVHGIWLANASVCEEHGSLMDFVSRAFFQQDQRLLALAAKLTGKTRGLSLLHHANSRFKPGCFTGHMGSTQQQADWCYEYVRTDLKRKEFEGELDGPPLRGRTTWKNGSRLQIMTGTIGQACLPGSQGVMTEAGVVRMRDIVEKRLALRVRSYSFSRNQWEWQRITDWHDNGPETSFYAVRVDVAPRRGCPPHRILTGTGNHLVLRPDGNKTPLVTLSAGDEVCIPGYEFSVDERQILLGLMLGDGTIDTYGRLCVVHGDAQRDYLDWLVKVFSSLRPTVSRHNGYGLGWRMRTKAHPDLQRLRRLWYPDGKKRIPAHALDHLGPLGLSIWLMDDGWRSRGRWGIATDAFTAQEHDRMAAAFRSMGLNAIVTTRKGKVLNVRFRIRESRALDSLCAEYLDTTTGKKVWKSTAILPGRDGLVRILVESVKPMKVLSPKWARRYDLTVENNHNYCVGSGLLVSNSGPHPAIAAVDELDQLDYDVWTHWSKTAKGSETVRAQILLASTRFLRYGTVSRVSKQMGAHLKIIPWCVPRGGTVVLSDGRPVAIETVEVGDVVISGSGRPQRVSAVWHRTFDGELIILDVHGIPSSIKLTPEHRIPTGRGWIEASEVHANDWVFEPSSPLRPGGSFGEGWLVGFYAAEGCLTKRGHGVMFGVHEREAASLMQSLRLWWPTTGGGRGQATGAGPFVCAPMDKSLGRTVYAYHRDLKQLMMDWVEGTSRRHTKALRQWPDNHEFAKGVLEGWLDGDGSSSGPGVRVGQSSSSILAWQMWRLATSLGYATSLRRYKNRGGPLNRGKSCPDAYRVMVSQHVTDERRWRVTSDGIWRKVGTVRREPYVGLVHDLTVENDHTFLAGGISVSNCLWDAMAPCPHDCENVPGLGRCPMFSRTTGQGEEEILCGGRAHRGCGHLTYDDVLNTFLTSDAESFDIIQRLKLPGTEGLFFSQFQPEVHVKPEFEYRAGHAVYLGYDDGFEHHACLGAWQEREEDGLLYQFDEIYEQHWIADQFAEEIAQRPWVHDVQVGWPDPNGKQSIEIFRRFFLNLLGRPVMTFKTDNDRVNGWRAVRRRLRTQDNRVLLGWHPRCVHTTADLAGLQRVEGTEDCQKKQDHGADQTRYLVYNLDRYLGRQADREAAQQGETPEERHIAHQIEITIRQRWDQLGHLGVAEGELKRVEARYGDDRREFVKALGGWLSEFTLAGRLARAGLADTADDEELDTDGGEE